MKKSFFYIIAVLFFGLFFIHCSSPSKDKRIDAILKEGAAVVNAQCPVDNGELILVKCEVLPERTFNYSYTVKKVELTADTAAFIAENKAIMVDVVKTLPQMRIYRDEKIIFKYTFRDRSDNYLCSFAVTPQDYND